MVMFEIILTNHVQKRKDYVKSYQSCRTIKQYSLWARFTARGHVKFRVKLVSSGLRSSAFSALPPLSQSNKTAITRWLFTVFHKCYTVISR